MEIISKSHFKQKTHFEVNKLFVIGYWINIRGFNIQVGKGVNPHLVSRQWSQWQYMIYSIIYIDIYVCLSGFYEWWTYVTNRHACMWKLDYLEYCFSDAFHIVSHLAWSSTRRQCWFTNAPQRFICSCLPSTGLARIQYYTRHFVAWVLEF